MSNSIPNSGSDEAIQQGCICPILDNAHGQGYFRQPGVFVFTEGCPLHWTPTEVAKAKQKNIGEGDRNAG